MKSLLLTRVAPVLILSATLAGGMAAPSFAQSTGTAPTAPTTPTTPVSPGTGSASGTTAAPAQGSTGSVQAPASTAGSASSQGTTGSAEATPGESAPKTITQMADQRIEQLHARLHITHAQEAKWNKFAQTMRSNARTLDSAYQKRADKIDQMNAIENMRSYAHIERMRADDMQKLVGPFESLYASLSPQQKQEANDLFRERAQEAQQRHQARATQSSH